MTLERFEVMKDKDFDDWHDFVKEMSKLPEARKEDPGFVTHVEEVLNDRSVASGCRICSLD